MPMFDQFTDNARKVMALAIQQALEFGHGYIGSEHILLGLVELGGRGAETLGKLGLDTQHVRSAVAKVVMRW